MYPYNNLSIPAAAAATAAAAVALPLPFLGVAAAAPLLLPALPTALLLVPLSLWCAGVCRGVARGVCAGVTSAGVTVFDVTSKACTLLSVEQGVGCTPAVPLLRPAAVAVST
jgi:hypothetical protein